METLSEYLRTHGEELFYYRGNTWPAVGFKDLWRRGREWAEGVDTIYDGYALLHPMPAPGEIWPAGWGGHYYVDAAGRIVCRHFLGGEYDDVVLVPIEETSETMAAIEREKTQKTEANGAK